MAWTTLADKITVGILMFLFSGIFGCLPMVLAAKCGLQADHPPTQRSKRKWKNVILAFLLNFGGGILSANAFCHWLPENVEGKVLNFLQHFKDIRHEVFVTFLMLIFVFLK